MNTHADKSNESQSVSAALSVYKNNTIPPFKLVDNRPKSISQLKYITTDPIQKMRAYDKTKPHSDPRHFSTADLKKAINKCETKKESVPWWLKKEIDGYLRNELSERNDDMQRHGGGDEGHKHYFERVRNLIDLVASLETNDDAIATGDAAIQL